MDTRMAAGATTRCTRLETAAGWILGLGPRTPLPHVAATPREALDDAIRPALQTGSCHITFSGGRDSSAVLAAATSLARREGHPLPIPVTRRYPHLKDTDEDDWQARVIDHLGLDEWTVLRFERDESDLLGPAARRAVRRRGALWPPALAAQDSMLERLTPGSLMTGEGGDAVLGERRITPWSALRLRRRPNRRLLALGLRALRPAWLRTRALRRNADGMHQSGWMTPGAMAEFTRRAAADEAAEPLRYDEATWYLGRLRAFAVMRGNAAAAAAEHGLLARDPLLDPGFLAALARAGGRLGPAGRTATMRMLFADVLPDEVLSRRSKASFNHAYTSSATRWFAAQWDGTGVDRELVDVDRLRDTWLSDSPTMAAGVLLHEAWLASGAPEP